MNTRDRRKHKREQYLKKLENKGKPTLEQHVNLSESDKQVVDFGVKVGKRFLNLNKDLLPRVAFFFDSKGQTDKIVMLTKNEDATALLSVLDSQLHEKYIISGSFDPKIYFSIFKELNLVTTSAPKAKEIKKAKRK
jgi:hypothetical protein